MDSSAHPAAVAANKTLATGGLGSDTGLISSLVYLYPQTLVITLCITGS